jgi:glycine cleavage system aminomethyltransferase T
MTSINYEKTNEDDFGFGTQIRKSPFFEATVRWGAKAFSVYNHMYIPRDFGDPVQNFWNLVDHAILCDVAVERQVEIAGPDAAKFVQIMSPRNLGEMKVGQCKYIILTNQAGGIINDPILLRIAHDRFWFSTADSDVILWALGLAAQGDYNVNIFEPDASPLQLQGPKSRDIVRGLFGDQIADLRYYWFKPARLDGIEVLVSRTGWSSELGFEIFLLDFCQGNELYDKIMKFGQRKGLQPGHTSTIRRIEGAMLSYHADMGLDTNPFELGMDRLIDLDDEFDFIGKSALKKIQIEGVTRKHVGLTIEGPPLPRPNTQFWQVFDYGGVVGQVTSAVYSPRLKQNIALAMVKLKCAHLGKSLSVKIGAKDFAATVVRKPFYDPKKAKARC